MKLKKLIVSIFAVTGICIISILFFSFMTLRFVRYSPEVCAESTEELQNPYIGWYQIYGYEVSDDSPYDFSKIPETESQSGLALLQLNLRNYANSPISDRGLSLLDQFFERWQSTGMQFIVRFVYDWDGNALETEPQDLSLILTHMSQTSEIVNRYKNCIYIIQGIFIGSWGEIHNSRYVNNDDMITLMNHLASVIDSDIFLAVRTPQQWRLLTGSAEPIAGAAASSGSLASRLSLFNDGMLGSDTDLSTYAVSASTEELSLYESGSRQEEILFQNLLCAYVPNGGEVVVPNPRNDFPAAVRDLSAMHVSYLNSDYDETVFTKWRTDTCTDNSLYNGMNGFDYISRHLGYRYVLRSSDCSPILPWEKTAELTLTLQNVGFSNCYRSFDVSLTLKEPVTSRTFRQSVKTDTCLWNTGEDIQLTAAFPIREYATGTYDIYLNITDPVSGCQVSLANDGIRAEEGHLLGQLDINILPGRDPH